MTDKYYRAFQLLGLFPPEAQVEQQIFGLFNHGHQRLLLVRGLGKVVLECHHSHSRKLMAQGISKPSCVAQCSLHPTDGE
jgi:hypothetical protein